MAGTDTVCPTGRTSVGSDRQVGPTIGSCKRPLTVTWWLDWQAYVLMMVLSMTANKEAAQWKGLLLILSLFVVNVLASATFTCVSTIGHIAGLSYFHRQTDGRRSLTPVVLSLAQTMLSVCPSVCLSHSIIFHVQLNMSPEFVRWLIVISHYFMWTGPDYWQHSLHTRVTSYTHPSPSPQWVSDSLVKPWG